eukprot:g5316.t1
MRFCRALAACLVALYAASLYRDRYKLRSFPAVARRFFPVGFEPGAMPPMRGRTVLVTGANSGLGLQSAAEMHKAGAHVVMGCRSETRCADARESVLHGSSAALDPTSEERLTTLQIDLASFASVRAAAATFLEKHTALDVLMLNAGGMFPHKLTQDGIEVTFQVSHLSHFLLARLLMPALLRSPTGDARIVAVTSDAHHFSYKTGVLGQPDLEAINDPAKTSSWHNYAQSKLSNVLFVREFSRRFEEAAADLRNNGSADPDVTPATFPRVHANAAHPGLVATRFIFQVLHRVLGFSYDAASQADAFVERVFIAIGLYFDLEWGALTQLYLSCSPDIRSNNITGAYYVPVAGSSPLDPMAENSTLAAALWTLSESATEESFDLHDLISEAMLEGDKNAAEDHVELKPKPHKDNRHRDKLERGNLVRWTGQEYMPSHIFLPRTSTSTVKHPVLVYTHGGPPRPPVQEMRFATRSLPHMLQKEHGDDRFAKAFPFIGIFPCSLCTADGRLRPRSELAGGPPVSGRVGWTQENFNVVDDLVRLAVRDFGGDPRRIFVTGQSYGGRGAWEYAAARPRMFAGIVPIAASLQPTPALLRAIDPRTPVWAFHGQNDESSDVRQSDMWVSALRSQPGRKAPEDTVKYTRYPEAPDAMTAEGTLYAVGHGAYELAYRDDALWEWMTHLECGHCRLPEKNPSNKNEKKSGRRRKRRRRRKKKKKKKRKKSTP